MLFAAMFFGAGVFALIAAVLSQSVGTLACGVIFILIAAVICFGFGFVPRQPD